MNAGWQRAISLRLYDALYRRWVCPLLFRSTAYEAHLRLLTLLRWADAQAWLLPWLGAVRGLVQPPRAVDVGGARLESPVMLAAGLVKGEGFASEEEALQAVTGGRNLIPGWRSVPQLVGLVEFGSFTRWPRPGNAGVVVWRDVPTRSTQNRVGLKNTGARAAAAFLGKRRSMLPRQFGINLAVSPGVTDVDQQAVEIAESIDFFAAERVKPAWVTLNISCPNTEDDPRGHQTADSARRVCSAAHTAIQAWADQVGISLPLWVKVGPNLGDEQYRALMATFADCGVQAVVATNTDPQPVAGQPDTLAGVGGGRLHARAVEVAARLMAERHARGYALDVIGCGGVQDGVTFTDFTRLGVAAVQIWSALVFRGPLAGALVVYEGDGQ